MSQPPGQAIEAVVTAAARGDEHAWAELVARYMPLVRAVIRRHGLTGADAADVNQTLWLRLVEHLDEIRTPAALPMWIIQTTRRESLRMLRMGRRTFPLRDFTDDLLRAEDTDLDEHLLRQERHQVLRDGFAQLPPRCQQLLAMLITDPPVSYEEISQRLAMPIGSIGPTRARCLHKLRTCPVVAAFAEAVQVVGHQGGERHDSTALERR